MILNTKKETVCVNKIIGQKLENILIEGDIIVPDIKPDLLNTISNNGNICIYKKEAMDEKIRIDGGINIYLIYLPDDENGTVRSLNTVLDFTKIIDFDGCKAGMSIDDSINIKSIECKILNGRKINVKVMLEANIKIYSNETIEIISDIEDLSNVEKLENIVEINSLLGSGESKTYAKETIMLDEIDTLAEILKVDISIINRESKISYNKVLAKAEANVKIMYLTEDNRINTVSNNIPVMGFVDMPNVTDDNICNIKYKLKNLLLKSNSVDERSIYIELELELCCFVYEKKKIKIIQDLYSPEETLEFTNRTVETRSFVDNIKDVMTLKEKINIEGMNENKIYDVDIKPTITDTKIGNGKATYIGEAVVIYTYGSDGINKIEVKEVKIPFEFTIDLKDIGGNAVIETSVEVQDDATIVNSDNSLETRLNLAFEVEKYKNQNMNIIDKIELNENKKINPYSMIIYFVKPNDTLWKIAKTLNSTVEDIVRVNNIENPNKIDVGMQLFIPRYVRNKVLV